VGALGRALDQTGRVIAGVKPDQAALPTPCQSWDVRALVNHIVHDVRGFVENAKGGAFRQGDDDVIGDKWIDAYGAAAADLLAAWEQPGATEGTITLPFGEFPTTWRVGQQIADLVVHAWDVATATDQSTDLEPELGQIALEWGRDNLKPSFRGDEASGRAFGLEVPVPDYAPLHDRLAGFFGRNPDVLT
jgi:uncharacterized protein (TIGR03086 family)